MVCRSTAAIQIKDTAFGAESKANRAKTPKKSVFWVGIFALYPKMCGSFHKQSRKNLCLNPIETRAEMFYHCVSNFIPWKEARFRSWETGAEYKCGFGP